MTRFVEHNKFKLHMIMRAALVATSACGFIASTHAQTADADKLDTVEVTAQKRKQNLQEVPISVQALSASDLEKAGVKDLFNLHELAPSMTGGQANRTLGARMGIRGINDFARNPGYDSSMGVYVDGVFAGRSEAASQSLVGMEKVEVLRGPQGTLFGKNTVAGALSLTTRKPTDQFEASANLDVGQYGTQNAGVWLGGEVSPGKIQMALTLGREHSNGWVDNLTVPSNRPGSGTGESARLLTRFITSPTTNADLSVWTSKYEGVPASGEAIAPSGLMAYSPGPRTTATSADVIGLETVSKTGASFNFDLDLAKGYRITSVTATQKAKNFYRNDDDLSPLRLVIAPGTENTTKQFSQEVRFQSPKSDQMDWLVGAYYLTQDNDQASSIKVGEDIGLALPSAGALAGRSSVSGGNLKSTTKALFAHGNLTLAPNWQFTGGVRFSNETKDVKFSQTSVPGFFANIPQFTGSVSDSDVSPKLGLNWFVQPDTMLYTSYSQGFKSGGYNMDTIGWPSPTNPAEQLKFKKQKVNNIEVGSKSEFLNRRVRLNTSIYSMNGTDWQVQQFSAQSNGTNVATITNAGEVRINGAEIDMQAKLPNGFGLKAGLAYTDAKFSKYENADSSGRSYTGNELPFAPTLKSSLALEKTIAYEEKLVRLNLGAVYTSKQYTNANNASSMKIDANTVVNASVALDSNKSKNNTVISLWAKNLTNAEYFSFVGATGLGQARGIYAAPRTIGVSLRYDL